MYGVSFFSLSKIKIGVFLALAVAYFGNEMLYIVGNEFVTTRPIEETVLSAVFYFIIFFVVAAFVEFAFYKGRKKWPKWF